MPDESELPAGLELLPRRVKVGDEEYSEATWYARNGWVRRHRKRYKTNLLEIGNFINEIYFTCTLETASSQDLLEKLAAEKEAEVERKEEAKMQASKSELDLLATEKSIERHERLMRKGRAKSIVQGGKLTRVQQIIQANIRNKLAEKDTERKQQESELRLYKHRVKSYGRSASVLGAKLKSMESIQQKKFQTADQTGGHKKRPRMFTVSFPGDSRNLLFQILASMHFQLEENPSTPVDVHVMNQARVGRGLKAKQLPKAWDDLFTAKSPDKWNELKEHLKTRLKYSGTGMAPSWFVKSWGAAAWYCANRTNACGCGVIAFTGWPGYDDSFNCRLEYLFCQCLILAFPRSVYEVKGTTESGETIGEYMVPDII